MPSFREQLVHQLQCQGPLSEQGAAELADAAVTEARGEAYPGELAELRHLARHLRVIVRYGESPEAKCAEVQALLMAHAVRDSIARTEAVTS
jgi:hypothetical protein